MASGVPKSAVAAREARGESSQCSHSHHERCSGGTCTCQCHSDPAAFEKRREANQAAAGRAWETRRAGGKAPASSSGAPGETAPKRPAIASGNKPAIPAAAAKQIKSEFAFGIWLADQGAATFRPQQWQTPDDRLREQEITALSSAVYNELEARAPWLLKLLASAQQSAPEAALVYTVAMIALPRLARHGAVVMGVKITPELANAVAIAPFLAAQQHVTGPGASDVGAESTPVADRADRYGQVDVGGAPAGSAPVHAGAAVQTGRGDLQNGSGDTDGARNGRYAP
jgi:hypothetical protein